MKFFKDLIGNKNIVPSNNDFCVDLLSKGILTKTKDCKFLAFPTEYLKKLFVDIYNKI